ncbi:hypothetical protein, partial [Paenibacillus apiarius]|uniref:hypothetical protein n=1 Tax=Paenibacillus apiarius TaxID=46240 RepID=UPI003B3B1487
TIENQVLDKPKDKWDKSEKDNAALNAKAMNAIYCALTSEEFNRVSGCDTAQDIWNTLEITHEGTSQVKQAKLEMLVSRYENFMMKDGETIYDMFTRFTDIVNKVKSLGKQYEPDEMVRKILRSLPVDWDSKITAIEESHDLTKMTLDHLVGNLITHEMRLKVR